MNYKLKSEKDIYKGRLLTLRVAKLTRGKYTFTRESVIHPGAIAIIPSLSRDKIILVNQYRYATGRALWEIPAGTINKGEQPLHCAKRELIEETGFAAKVMKKLGAFYLCPGYSSEKIHLYSASGLTKASATPDIDEDIKSKVFTRPEIIKLLKTNKIIDAKTIIGLLLWIRKQI
jgi:ADP-ribose pyrophosphatase